MTDTFKRIVEPWAPLTFEERKRLDVPFEREEWYFGSGGKMNKVEHHWKHTREGLVDEGRKGSWIDPTVNYEQMVKIFDLMKKHDCTLARALVEVVGEENFSQTRLQEVKKARAFKHRNADGYQPPTPTPQRREEPDVEWKDLREAPKERRVLKKVGSAGD